MAEGVKKSLHWAGASRRGAGWQSHHCKQGLPLIFGHRSVLLKLHSYIIVLWMHYHHFMCVWCGTPNWTQHIRIPILPSSNLHDLFSVSKFKYEKRKTKNKGITVVCHKSGQINATLLKFIKPLRSDEVWMLCSCLSALQVGTFECTILWMNEVLAVIYACMFIKSVVVNDLSSTELYYVCMTSPCMVPYLYIP